MEKKFHQEQIKNKKILIFVKHTAFLRKCTIILNTLLCSLQGSFLYAGSDSGVVQSPAAFCNKYLTCTDCVLARDPYCAWDTHTTSCVNIFLKQHNVQQRLVTEHDVIQVMMISPLSVLCVCTVCVFRDSSGSVDCR